MGYTYTTVDKLFLLSESEVCTDDMASVYGFVQNEETYDEARRCNGSDYAKAMGVRSSLKSDGNCTWWLRQDCNGYVEYVSCDGEVNDARYYDYPYDDTKLIYRDDGVRVALNLDLSASNLYMYAGTICSDGIISESGNAEKSISNPRIVEVAYPDSRNVKWDSIYFGNYPQTEVKNTDSEYSLLQDVKGWDSNGDIVVNGTKYRRMLKGDATYTSSGSGYYDWEDDTTYHYFRYEPVKWRVLKTDGNSAMLLSDMVLDYREYGREYDNGTWETSTIRSWLNGYDAEKNCESIDYGSSNFIDSAFTSEEKSAIEDTNVVNNDNLRYGTEGGNDTIDKLFLLSESEVYSKESMKYGFSQYDFVRDISRQCRESDYAKAMGVKFDSDDNSKDFNFCNWWLRSPGYYRSDAASVMDSGYVYMYGNSVTNLNSGVRVALNLNLSSSNLYTYAGVVCNDDVPPNISFISIGNDYLSAYISDWVGVAGYYFGTDSIYTNNPYKEASDWVMISEDIENSGTYYLTAEDISGNISETYSVTFYKTILDANGGTVSQSEILTKSGNTVTLPEAFREGYTFKGWSLSKASDTGERTITPTGNNTYYAVWSSQESPAKKQQTIKAAKSYEKVYGAKPFKLNAKLTKGNGKLSYTTSNKKVATVDRNGKVTIKGTGICTITVTASATDTYKSASAKITITVKPKKNTVTKMKSSGGRTLDVTWKKDTQGSGYELQYATVKSFSGKSTVTVNISKNRTASYKIRKLLKGKKYYVRVRTYRNVKTNGKTKKLYGDWSSVKQSGKIK